MKAYPTLRKKYYRTQETSVAYEIMNFVKIIILLSILLLLFDCNDRKIKEINSHLFIKQDTLHVLYIDVKNDSVFKDARVLIDIQDTLQLGKRNFGDLYSVKFYHDSIKRDFKEDFRGVVSCIGISDSKFNEEFENVKSCDSFYQVDLNFEKVRIPFYVIPNKKGRLFINGRIKEQIFLNAYKYEDSTVIRYIELEHHFELPVYVK